MVGNYALSRHAAIMHASERITATNGTIRRSQRRMGRYNGQCGAASSKVTRPRFYAGSYGLVDLVAKLIRDSRRASVTPRAALF